MRIKDVAGLAGVSTAAISHVINDTQFVSEETKQKAQAAIEKCDYTPNARARSLALGRSRALGLLKQTLLALAPLLLLAGAARAQSNYSLFSPGGKIEVK